MLKVWGRRNSSNVQKVMWAIGELNLDHEHVPLGGSFGGLDDPQYRQINPNGLVPTLRDDDLIVWESHAVVRYLAARYGAGGLWPEPPQRRAVVDQWTDWTATTFGPAWIRVFWLAVRTPADRQDARAIAAARGEAERAFAVLDGQLAKTEYLGGEMLTYADIVAGVAMYRCERMQLGGGYPNAQRWYGDLSDRDAYRQHVMVAYDELVGRLSF